PLLSFDRISASILRRVRLLYMRRRYPGVKFGSRCDIRSGLHLALASNARVEFGSRCILDREMTIECDGVLKVGARTVFGHHCTLAVRDSLLIGEDCLIAEMVSIRDHDHSFERLDVPTLQQGMVSSPVLIGRNVWLGAKVTVVKGVEIGDNAVVGANAVVTKNIPANSIAVGVPARVVRFRTEPRKE
ncbi:MAG: acyltransferase, partial [Armatimonadota bacterium]|nr:acyltransferase [Armatimonadota bacterium]